MHYDAPEELPPLAMEPSFSPSGHALAFRPLLELETIAVQYRDGREPQRFTMPAWVLRLMWASDDELIYSLYGRGNHLHRLSLSTGESYPLTAIIERERSPIEIGGGGSFAPTNAPGILSYFGEHEMGEGLFALDARTGNIERLTAFDPALKRLEVYPLFGHSWSAEGNQVAVAAWPFDYLPEGVEGTEENSRWNSMIGHPSVAHYPVIKPDGTRTTQGEMAKEARRKRPWRLFLLSSDGTHRELPDTHHAQTPFWAADNSMIFFRRQEKAAMRLYGVRLRDDFVERVADISFGSEGIPHPNGIIYFEIQTEPRKSQWRRLRVTEGAVHWL